jgi:Nucleoside diphosphate kinase
VPTLCTPVELATHTAMLRSQGHRRPLCLLATLALTFLLLVLCTCVHAGQGLAAVPTVALVDTCTVEERTFVAIKPEGLQRALVGEIVSRLERKGLRLVALKLQQPTPDKVG